MKAPRLDPRSRRRLAAALALVLLAGSAAAQRRGGEDGIPPGFRLVHGDILIPADQPVPEGGGCDQSGSYSPVPWPDGIVPFTFDAAVTSTERNAMHAAMDEWNQSGADVTFVPIVNPDPAVDRFVTIQDSTGNNSNIGMNGPGQNTINIFNWDYEFIMAHELSHTLGFWHEQSRPDRGTYVSIQCGSVSQTACSGSPCDSNFRIENNWPVLNTPYDFDSVMHYDQCAFSIVLGCPTFGGWTILVNPPYQAWQYLIGQRDHLSSLDVDDMIDLYGSSNGPRYVDPTSTFPVGLLSNPFRTVAEAEFISPPGSGIWLADGTYAEGPITLDGVNTWRPYPGASVTIR